MDFHLFSKEVELTKKEEVTDKSSMVTLFSAAINRERLDTIDFDLFSSDELLDAIHRLDQAVYDQDDDGGIYLDPLHVFTQTIDMQYKISALVSVPKRFAGTPHRFI